MPKIKVISHIRGRRGKRFRVRKHSRSVKSRAVSKLYAKFPSISQKEAGHSFDEIMKSIKADIKTVGKASIPGFGTFKRKRIPARKGGKKIHAFGKTFISKSKPVSVKIKFYPSKTLKRI